ncbi:MAG: hypothetical protein EXS46_02105 [Candidatus Taylorbacteria bacterium]|nr:hypothetical protein [Candidatus Taylorbacteria bacterium]
MAKQEAEWSNRLGIFWLKKHGYLDGGWRFGGIKWAYGGNKSSISFTVCTNEETGDNITLQYRHTNHATEEKESMDYKVELTATPCNYGSKRYWFICPLSKNGKYCGRRVGVLFSIGKWFGCRHCGNVAYTSQMQGGRNKGFISIPDIERAEKEVKRYYYKGRPTRKYRRLMRLNKRLEMGWIMMASKFDKSFGNHKK